MGSPIMDYRIWYNNNGTTFVVLASSVTSLPYIVSGLTKGLTYQFYVQARNSLGYS